jgi:hypothetical protein
MVIRMTCRSRHLGQRQLIARAGFIVPSREFQETSYMGTSENSRILHGSV